MSQIKIARGGTYINADSHTQVMRALAESIANQALKAGVSAGLTDSSGGTAGSATSAVSATVVNAANSGTNLAPKVGTEAALNLVKDAILELATKANEMAGVVGTRTITYNGGGTAADGTINAIGNSGTAASTGVQAASINATTAALDQALYNVIVVANQVAVAAGLTPISIFKGNLTATVGAITVAGGTAADPGVTKVAMDAVLTAYANKIAAVAAKLNAARTIQAPKVVAS